MNFVDQDVPATLDLALKISAEPRTDQSAGPTEYVGDSLLRSLTTRSRTILRS